WFDVVGRPDDTVAVVFGDVMGHGDSVAAAADCLSRTMRALAGEGHDPEVVMGAAREQALRLATTATAVYGVVDLATGGLEFCSAGHPAPALLDPMWRGWLPLVPTPLLGAGWTEGEDCASVLLASGEIVVIYSDGLADASGSLPDVTARLMAEAAAGGANPYQLCSVALSATGAGTDDRSVLVLTLSEGLADEARGHTWSAHR
ncbi:MAG TPA: PP2C family protein-serine/threonine phosphatase, partial [Acidimicrobiales bacterium]|nr:PP2C family protein-serine/threonine phosphatase [Acidimicrobiales bacterium]